MTDATRRRFLSAAGLSTAAVAAATVGGEAVASAQEPVLPGDAEGPMVAYVRDVRKGELALMIEGREVIVRDKNLVTRLAAAFARAGR
jgi:hypothetical protein